MTKMRKMRFAYISRKEKQVCNNKEAYKSNKKRSNVWDNRSVKKLWSDEYNKR